MNARLLLLLFVAAATQLLMHHSRCNAFEITNTEAQMYSSNGTLYTRQVVGIRCDQPDYGHNNSVILVDGNSVERNMSIYCGAPTVNYVMQLVGYVPLTVVPFISEHCAVISTLGLIPNEDNFPIDTEGGGVGTDNAYLPMNRRPKFKEARFRSQSHAHTVHRSKLGPNAKRFAPMFSIGGLIKKAASFACSKSQGYVGCKNDGLDDLKDDMKELQAATKEFGEKLNTFTERLDNFANATTAAITAQGEQLANLLQGLTDVEGVTTGLQDQIDILANMTALNQQHNDDVARALDEKIVNTQEALNSTLSQLQDLATLFFEGAGVTDAALASLANQTNAIVADVAEKLSEEAAARGRLQHVTLMQIKRLATAIFSLAGQIRYEATFQQFRVRLTQLARVNVDDAINMFNLVPFLEDIGEPAATPEENELVWRFHAASLHVFHATDPIETTETFARHYQFELYCNTPQFVLGPPKVYGAYEIMNGLIGPAGCVADSAATVTCKCWVDYRVAQCITDDAHLNTSDWIDSDSPLSAREADVCVSGFTDGGSFDRLTDASLFTNAMFDICNGGMRPPGGGYPTQLSQYLVVGASSGKRLWIDYDETLCESLSKMQENAIGSLDLEEDAPIGLMYALYQFMEMGMSSWMVAIPELQAILVGEMPQRADIEYYPLARIFDDDEEVVNQTGGARTRKEGRCMQTLFVAWSPMPADAIPVYRVTPLSTNTTITVYTEGEETQSFSVAISLDAGGFSFSPAADLIVGDPTSVFEIFDIPYSELGAGPYYTRRDTVTANLVPYNESDPSQPVEWNAVKFFESTGVRYEHTQGAIPADLYLVQIMANGSCNLNQRDIFHGRICNWRDNYDLTPSIPIELPGIDPALTRFFSATPSASSGFSSAYNAEIHTLTGQLVTVFVSACPIVNVVDAPKGIEIQLSNQRGEGDSGTILFRLTRHGDCCTEQQLGNVDSGATKKYFFDVCLNTDDGQCAEGEPHVEIERLVIESSTYTHCTNVSLNVSASAYLQRGGLIGELQVQRTTTVDVDGTVLASTDTMLEMAEIIAQLSLIILERDTVMYIPVTLNFTSGINSIIDRAYDLVGDIGNVSDRYRDKLRNQTDLADLDSAYYERLDNLTASMEAARNATQAKFDALNATLNATAGFQVIVEELVGQLQNSTAQLSLAIAELQNATTRFVNGLIAFSRTVVDSIDDFSGGNWWSAIEGIAGAVGGAIDATIGNVIVPGIGMIERGVNNAAKLGAKIAKGIEGHLSNWMNKMSDAFDDLMGGFGAIFQIIVQILMIGGICVGVYFLIQWLQKRRNKTPTDLSQTVSNARFDTELQKRDAQIAQLTNAINQTNQKIGHVTTAAAIPQPAPPPPAYAPPQAAPRPTPSAPPPPPAVVSQQPPQAAPVVQQPPKVATASKRWLKWFDNNPYTQIAHNDE